MVHISTRG